MIADKILIKSQPINGRTPAVRVYARVDFVWNANHTVPIRYITAVPVSIPRNCNILFSGNLSPAIPDMAERNKYPVIYPPVGPVIFASPPENPEKTGKPTLPRRIYAKQLNVADFAPRISVLKRMIKVDAETGTAPVGIVMGAMMHKSAVITADNEIVFMFVFIMDYLKELYRTYNSISVDDCQLDK